MMFTVSHLFQLLVCASAAAHHGSIQDPFSAFHRQTEDELDLLRKEVGDRLFKSYPFASPCYDSFESQDCVGIRKIYLNDVSRTGSPVAYMQPQWETCQASEDQCMLDSSDPDSTEPLRGRACAQGSVSAWTIEVKDSNDVKAAFRYAKQARVPLVIKNTGHDYKGRSSAPGSLALWTHNLKEMSYHAEFVPEGCSEGTEISQPGVTLQAGVQWGEAYAFAEQNNITIVGGADRTVGAVGGWLQGGGHGVLSNTMGLGVDRVMQFKLVTPDGGLRIANDCQNQDLFFALRGGGGGTFGVVMEATVQASPQVRLQTVMISFNAPNSTRTSEAWSLLTEHGLKLSEEGWGGYSNAKAIVLVNPAMSTKEAVISAAAIIEFGKRIQQETPDDVKTTLTEYPSFGAFFRAFSGKFVALQGQSLALASRLVPKGNFHAIEKRKELVSALLAAESDTPGVILLMTTPASVPSSGRTSVTEAWRESLIHVTTKSVWQWNATKDEVSQHYAKVGSSMDHLRRITPDAAYSNESDVYEPNFEVSFWGEHYERLLAIKRKYDPDHLLDCWQCVGWNPDSARFSCYLPAERFQ